MDFAKKQLLKFGWTEGKGLGKYEDGISEALKPKLKFDNTGVGHNSSEQYTFNWWENVFNNAADNLNVTNSKEGGVKIDLHSDESVNITTKKYIIRDKQNQGLEYGSFLKTAKLTGEGMFEHEDKEPCTAEDVVLRTVNLTDDELFAACGGRTAHKGARHGLKLNGKLSRIEQQEKELAKLFTNNNTNEEINKKMVSTTEQIFNEFKKVNKTKKKSKITEENTENLDIESDSCLEVKKKKKRKRILDKSDNEEDHIELEAEKKRYENFCYRKYNKKLKRKRKREEKQFSKISDMFENCSLDKQKSDDDGFDEHVSKKKIKLSDDTPSKKQKKKKKNKLDKRSNEDAGFCELMNEISDKLTESKDIRRRLKIEKKKYDDERVSNISDVLDRVCKV